MQDSATRLRLAHTHATVVAAIAAVLALSWATSCRQSPPAPPPCERVAGVSDEAVGDAGCLIAVAGRVIFVQDRASGGFGAPGGHGEPGETAACTASRETWEEAGLRVRVGRLLVRHDNGFHLFACEPLEPIVPEHLLVPAWGKDEIAAVRAIDPTALDASEWRFPEYRQEVIRLAKELGAAVR